MIKKIEIINNNNNYGQISFLISATLLILATSIGILSFSVHKMIIRFCLQVVMIFLLAASILSAIKYCKKNRYRFTYIPVTKTISYKGAIYECKKCNHKWKGRNELSSSKRCPTCNSKDITCIRWSLDKA